MAEVPRLVTPTVDVHASFLAALTEFQAEGRYLDVDIAELRQPRLFAAYVTAVRCDGLPPGRTQPPGWVAMTLLWWIKGDEYFGRISIRHELTPALKEYGGHIGYDVRPSARRRGHATRMLAAARPIAHRLGINPVLLTCHESNIASIRVIEANGGIAGEQRGERCYFWLPTHP